MSFKVGRQMSCILQVSRTHLGRLSGDQDKGKCQIGRYKTGDPSHQTSDSTDKTPIQICFKANIAMYSEKSERERDLDEMIAVYSTQLLPYTCRNIHGMEKSEGLRCPTVPLLVLGCPLLTLFPQNGGSYQLMIL